MENKTYIFIILGLVLIVGIGVVTAKKVYYSFDCKPLSDTEVAFMQAIAPVMNRYYANYQIQHPLTSAGKSLLNRIYTVQNDNCKRIIAKQ